MLLAGMAMLVVAALCARAISAAARADRGNPHDLVAHSLSAFAAGNVSLARAQANRAARLAPDWGLAHAVAARMALAVGDGITAEAELARAASAGFDMARVRHLFAHARLLQGDARGALEEVQRTLPRFRGYALTVMADALAATGDDARAGAAYGKAIAAAPASAAPLVAYGRFLRDRGDLGGAGVAAERARGLAPGDPAVLLLNAQLVRGRNGLMAALPWYRAALARDPHNYAVLIDYAATLGDAGQARAMLSLAMRALDARPNDPQALYLLSVLAARADRVELARTLLIRAGDGMAGKPGALLLGATLDLMAGGSEQAVGKLRNLLGLQPMNLQARRMLGLALLKGNAPRDALDVLRPLALRPDADSYTLTLAARGFEAIGNRGMAAQLLDRAAQPAQGDALPFGADDSVAVLAAAFGDAVGRTPRTTSPLVRSYLGAGDVAGAIAQAEKLVANSPGSPAAHTVLGDTLMAVRRPAAAIAPYERAANLRFDEPAMLRLAGAMDAAGRRADALGVLSRFLEQNPRNVTALRLQARWQVARGDARAAIATLEGLRARIGNRDAALLAELALAYDAAGDAAIAASLAGTAYTLAPLNPAAVDAYGWTMFGAGEVDGARQLIEKAVALAPGHAGLRWHLAQVYAALGMLAEARAEARAALTDPRFPERLAATALAAG